MLKNCLKGLFLDADNKSLYTFIFKTFLTWVYVIFFLIYLKKLANFLEKCTQNTLEQGSQKLKSS